MIKDKNLKEKDDQILKDKVKITIRDTVYTEGKVWFCPEEFNSLFSMDINTREVKLVGLFPQEPYRGLNLYSSIKLINNKIYCIPLNAKSIGVYDINMNKFAHILIDRAIAECKRKGYYYSGAIEYKKYLFIFPFSCSCIIRLDLDNYNVDYISDWYEEVRTEIFDENGGFFNRQIIEKDGILYASFRNINAILELNAETLHSNIHRLGMEQSGYSGICCDGDNLWMLSCSKDFIRGWNKYNDKIINIKLDKNSKAYTGIFAKEKSSRINGAKIIKSEKKNIITLIGNYYFVKEEKEFMIFYQDDIGLLTIYNEITGVKLQIKLLINYKYIDVNRLYEEKGQIKETFVFNIKNYLFMNNKVQNEQGLNILNIGKKIYTNI